MPSMNKQINVRVDPETEELVEQLIPALSQALGLKVSQSDLFRMGLHALKKQYLDEIPKKGRKLSNGNSTQ